MKFIGFIASVALLGLAAADSCKHSRFTIKPPVTSTSTEVDSVASSSSGSSVTIPTTTEDEYSSSSISSFSGTSSTISAASSSTSGSQPNFAQFFDQDKFHMMFPDAVSVYNLTVSSVQQATEEYAWNTYTVWQYCDNTTMSCAPGCRYHGRGPIQLSWNYNYYSAGQALGIDLLSNPDIVANDTKVTWLTALWFWMSEQGSHSIHDVVAGENGFAEATKVINGALECGPNAPNKANEQQRVEYYTKMCDALDVQPLGSSSSCNA
ncbi:unnamed protein product [Phytophthora fragariaefolia]|uniref:Unnamed protein product n=1 Tax=Phytophthora fragariaefolia TaxID=1490495 RepID=A0A9W7CNF5_9STRA|nr:unnamed protein product [Phytophthora fragariaefolia]